MRNIWAGDRLANLSELRVEDTQGAAHTNGFRGSFGLAALIGKLSL